MRNKSEQTANAKLHWLHYTIAHYLEHVSTVCFATSGSDMAIKCKLKEANQPSSYTEKNIDSANTATLVGTGRHDNTEAVATTKGCQWEISTPPSLSLSLAGVNHTPLSRTNNVWKLNELHCLLQPSNHYIHYIHTNLSNLILRLCMYVCMYVYGLASKPCVPQASCMGREAR